MTHDDMAHGADDEMWSDDGATAPTDDLLDARIARLAAAHYHRPPDIAPRDTMWDAIVTQRTAQQAAASAAASAAAASTPALTVVAGAAHPAREQRARGAWAHRAWARRSSWWLAAAASITLATGVGLGRLWSAYEGGPVAAGDVNGASQSVAVAPTESSRTDTTVGASTYATPTHDSALSDAMPDVTPEPRALATTTRRAPRYAGPRDADLAYRLATLRHLTEVEALLVSYRDENPEDAALDARLSGWARRLLDDTRLLMDSPAANDPRRRRLLEDLELVLVQMTQLDAAAPDRERPLIDETLRHSQLMPRLRAAVPAGVAGAT